MRAVTGTIASTKPCSTLKASRVLQGFESNAPSAGILSSDAATYLRTAIEAANDLHLFRGYLRLRQLREEGEGGSESMSGRRRRAPPVDEDGREGGGGSEKRHRPAPEGEDGRWEPKVEEEEYVLTVPASAEKKISERKGSRENVEKQGIAAPPHGDSHSPATEKRRKRKEKPVKDEDEAGDPVKEQSRKSIDSAMKKVDSAMKKKKKEKLVKDEDEAGDLVKEQSRTPLDSGKKKKKHLKQEDLGVEEAEEKMVRVGVAENGMTSEKKRRKNRKHTEVKEVKQEVVDDSDLGSDKKRKKKKRGRDGDNGNDTELVENTSKKQRK